MKSKPRYKIGDLVCLRGTYTKDIGIVLKVNTEGSEWTEYPAIKYDILFGDKVETFNQWILRDAKAR